MTKRRTLLTLFLLCAFFLQTATFGFANQAQEPTPEQTAAKDAYEEWQTSLNTKWPHYDKVDNVNQRIRKSSF